MAGLSTILVAAAVIGLLVLAAIGGVMSSRKGGCCGSCAECSKCGERGNVSIEETEKE